MRLLFYHTGSDLYGSSRSALRLLTRLTTDGHQTLAVLPSEGPLNSLLEKGGVAVKIDPHMPVLVRTQMKTIKGIASFPISIVRSFLFNMRLVREFRPDIIHTNTAALFPVPGLIACLKRIKHVWHIREFFEDHPWLWQIFQTAMGTTADKIIAVSTPVADQFRRQYRKKTVVIHNGFPSEEFLPVPTNRVDAFLKAYNLEGHLLVGVAGRIKLVRKGQETFVRAAALLQREFPEVRFLLIGSPFPGNESHLTTLRELINDLRATNVVYIGTAKDIKATLSALDILVMSSGRPEPFGGVVIEAMAFGKPVVGTNIGGTIEQVADGKTGILIPPNEPEAMAGALRKLLSQKSLCKDMGHMARKRFEDLFEFESFYAKISDLYERMLS